MDPLEEARERMTERHGSDLSPFFRVDAECRPIRQFPGIRTLTDLLAVLEQTWCRETATPSRQNEWIEEDPSFAQSAITSMLTADLFGATIWRVRTEEGSIHYFNRLAGSVVDLTREQYDLYDMPIHYGAGREVPREACDRNPETVRRYRLLQKRIMDYLAGRAERK
ncbi:MAG: YunG family protein [Anaerovoracaceae bacterium]|jgi:hypothetical protein